MHRPLIGHIRQNRRCGRSDCRKSAACSEIAGRNLVEKAKVRIWTSASNSSLWLLAKRVAQAPFDGRRVHQKSQQFLELGSCEALTRPLVSVRFAVVELLSNW